MLKKIIVPMMILTLSLGSLAGCQTMGKATGDAAQEAERGAEDFKEGYEQGKND
jgi:hypothetical protein